MTTAHDPDRLAALIEKWRAEADVSDALVDAGEITPQVAEHERGTAFASRLCADELEAALAVPVLASPSVVTLLKWLRHDEVCPTRNNPKAVLACSCGLNDAVLATLSATQALASAGERPKDA